MLVDPENAERLLLEVVQTHRLFRTAGQNRGQNEIAGTKVGVLHCLTQQDARLSAIADQLTVSISVVSRAVESLERDGLVKRRSDKADGRAYLISVTDKGRTELAKRYRYFAQRFAGVLKDWSPQDVEDTITTLQRLNEYLDQLTDVLEIDERDTL